MGVKIPRVSKSKLCDRIKGKLEQDQGDEEENRRVRNGVVKL
ncbi:hypothetical protein Gotur_033082 [Gossypium turneri]